MKCVSEKWKEVFVVNELSFEPLKDSCTIDGDTPIIVAKDVLKYPEQVREFMENGYWWANGGDIAEISMGAHVGTGQDDGQIVFKTASNAHSDSTGLVERVRILSTGGMTFNGDTTSANALDDYEEGTWTPTVVGGGYSVGRAYYIKVGRKVNIFVNVGLSNNNSYAFTVTLPYAAITS